MNEVIIQTQEYLNKKAVLWDIGGVTEALWWLIGALESVFKNVNVCKQRCTVGWSIVESRSSCHMLIVSSHFWILAHSAVQSCCSSDMILFDWSSSLRVHRSSAANGVRYPFTTSLRRWFIHTHTHNRQRNTHIFVNKYKLLLQWVSRRLKISRYRRTILPGEPPEEDLWQERGILDGTGILQQIKDQTDCCFRSKSLNAYRLSRHARLHRGRPLMVERCICEECV